MTNVIEIPKYDESKTLEGNSPSWMVGKDFRNDGRRPIVICQCGIATGIGKHHIHADGRVTASYFHSKKEMPDGCGWHVYIKLKDWDGGEMQPIG